MLWFNYGDLISIHALAAAANECYHGIGKKQANLPTIIQTWKKSLSDKDRKEANAVQNFAKHANTDPGGAIRVNPEYAELLILDSVMCHARLSDKKMTPLMRCFYARFAFENPVFIDHVVRPEWREYFLQAIKVEKLGQTSRVDYLNEVLPALADGW